LKWGTDEKNGDLKENICRLYDINLMWSTVQKDYIEQVLNYMHKYFGRES
jgi:hypothetical protein